MAGRNAGPGETSGTYGHCGQRRQTEEGKSAGEKFRTHSQQARTSAAKVRMEKQGKRLEEARDALARQTPETPPGTGRLAGRLLRGEAWMLVHGRIYRAEQENVGIEAAHRSELAGEAALRTGSRLVRRKFRERPYRTLQQEEERYEKAKAQYHYRTAAEEHPELEKKNHSRSLQKKRTFRQHQKEAREAARAGKRTAEKTAATTDALAKAASEAIKRHPAVFLILLLCLLPVVMLQSCVSSLATLGNGAMGAVTASTYPATDDALYGAEAAYCALEAELQSYLDTYENTHSYDEYHYDLDDIGHDPYVLLSMVSAWHEEGWTLTEAQATLQLFFEQQYTLTESVVREVRYRTETFTWEDEQGVHTGTRQVPYDYYICTVTLENAQLSHLPVTLMGEEQLSRYALYMATLGNRPDLFPSSPYVERYVTNPPAAYQVPEGYLADAAFAAVLEEAEKYLGYPYVWGGYSPATSFDCSGFVSYVYNQCGYSLGRLGAQGLYDRCTPVAAPRPGDLVFFIGTTDTPGISHCGIYVGDGVMLHAGDPIQYENLNSNYWQSHLYAYGRLHGREE